MTAIAVVTGVSQMTVQRDESPDCSNLNSLEIEPDPTPEKQPATGLDGATRVTDPIQSRALTARLAAIRTAEADGWAAHDARLDEFRASIMAGLAELREFVAVPAWRHMLHHLRGGDLA